LECNFITNFFGVFELVRKPCKFATNKHNISMFSCRFDGDAEFYCNGVKTKASAGEVLYIPPNVYYEQQALTDEHLIAVHFRAEPSLCDRIRVFDIDKNIAFSLFSDILRHCNDGNIHKCISLLYDMIHLTFEMESRRFGSHVSDGFGAAVEYMNSHYAESSTTISMLAEISGYSETYFREVFKENFGTAPFRYLTALRMQKAEMLLSGGYHSVKQIAHMCGYDDEKNFSSAFKKFTGQSPISRMRK